MPLDTTIGGASADSYISDVDLQAYWDSIGFDYSSYDASAIEVAARKATKWLDGVYGDRFGGSRASGRAQALNWPRNGVYDREGQAVAADEIPREIVSATAEAARYAISGTDLSPKVTAGQIVKREKVSSIEVEYLATSDPDAQRPVLTVVEDILLGLLSTSGNTEFVMRA